MKKKIIIIVGIIIAFIAGIYFVYSRTVLKKYIGVWESQDTGQTIEIFKDGTAFLYKSSILDEVIEGKKRINIAETGKLDEDNLVFSDMYDSSGCVDIYTAVEDIPKDDFQPIIDVYKLEFQGKEVFSIVDVTQNNANRILFRKTSNNAEKHESKNEKEASDYEMSAFFDENTSEEQKESLKQKIEELEGVSSVTYISAKEMWNDFKERYFGGDSEDLEGFGNNKDNPLSDSEHFEIYYKIKYKSSLIQKIKNMDGIRSISYY